MDPNQSDVQLQGQHLIQRCVIVQRDERGYGLTVTGDNPVYVQSVKDDGAANRAGVQVGDRIIKVNGTVVTHLNHIEVVDLIKSGLYVALTLLGRPPAVPLSAGTNSSTSDQITPRKRIPPSTASTRDHCKDEKTLSVERVLSQERVFYEQTREEYMKNPSERLQKQLAESTKRIKAFGAELAALTGNDNYMTSVSSGGPLSAPPGRTQNQIFRSQSMSDSEWVGKTRGDLSNENSDSDKSAPPLPPERKYKTEQLTSQLTDNTDNSTKTSSKSTKSRTLPGRLRKKPALLHPEPPSSHHIRQHSSPEAFFRTVEGEGNTGSSRKKSRDKKHSVDELTSSGSGMQSPSSPSFLKKALLNRRSPMLQATWNSEQTEKRSANGSSPTPNTGDLEPVEKRERSDTVLSNDDDSAFAPNNDPTMTKTEGTKQMQIFCPDEEEFLSDEEIGEEHGPFIDLELLKNKPAHLAVFLHYLISNSDPSSLFFWLVTDSHREGNYKEMRKWSYEIYSTFLADKAPLKVDIDKGIVQAIEATLGKECSEECLRNLFIPARSACTNEINDQLADFRSKRALGLGSLFGDNQLEDENMDRSKEMRVVEQILMHHLDNSLIELDSSAPNSPESDRNSAMASALTTFMKQAGLTVKAGSNYGNILEKCSSFTQKEGKSLFKIKQSKRVKNHHLVSTHYTNVTYCNKCYGLLWGIGDQGYQCTVCEYNVHKACYELIEEPCPGPKKRKKGNGGTSMRRANIPKRTVSSAEDHALNRHVTNVHLVPSFNQPAGKDRVKDLDINEDYRTRDGSADENSLPRRGDRLYPTRAEEGGDAGSCSEGEDRSVSSPEESLIATPNTVKRRRFVMRSESVKTPKEIAGKKTMGSVGIMPRSGRKSVAVVGDFSRGVVELQESGVLNYGRGNDSPTLALDAVSEDAKRLRSRSATFPYTEEEMDSDMEADTQPPWQQTVDKKILKKLKQKEIKRQEVIHELIHTEKTHVRNLKVLDKVFYRPMKKMNIWQYDMIKLLFPNLDELIQVHVDLLQAMKKRELEEDVISNIGDIMLDRFDGEAGEKAKEACATFCNNQKYALDQLKQRKAKDQKLAQFITNCEMNPLCRRLKLNEIISTSYQRLTKYPLLLEAINKNTPGSLPDNKDIERAIACTRELLAYVNQSVKECENHQRLLEFQKKIDKRQIENNSARNMDEVRNLDLTKKKLIYDGPLTWKISRNKSIDLHVLLLEDMVILLQKQDDRLILKCHSTNMSNAYQEKTTHSPMLKLNNLLTRNVATDKRAFFLVGTSAAGPLIYELVAATITERKNWFKHLTETAESIKVRDRGRRGGLSVGGGPRSNGTETPPHRRRGGMLPPGISPFPIQENGKSNEEEEEEKEPTEATPTEEPSDKENTIKNLITEGEEDQETGHEPDIEPETETETETETGEDLESESEPLPPPPPPLENITDLNQQETIARPTPQIRTDRHSPPPITVPVSNLSSLYDKTFVADLTNEESVDEKSPTQTSVISAFSESGSSSSSSNETMKSIKSYGHCSVDDHDDAGSSISNRSSLVLLAEQLRGKDEELKRTLQDKERIIAELRGAVMTSGYSSSESHVNSDPMEARDLILAAILQANRLTVAVSDILSPGPGDEDVSRSFTTSSLDRSDNEGAVSPQQQLVLSTSILNEQLTALLGIITDRDMARESLQSELQGANSQIQRLKQGRSSSRRTRDCGSSSYLSRDDDDDDVYHGFRSADLRRPSSPTSSAADVDSDYAPLSEASASDWLSEDNMDVVRSASFTYRDRNSLISPSDQSASTYDIAATSGYRSSTASSYNSRHRYTGSKTLYWSDDPDTESQF